MKFTARSIHTVGFLILALALVAPIAADERLTGDGGGAAYAEKIHMEDASGSGAEGGARVVRGRDDTQGFWFAAGGLNAEMPYSLIVDGFLAASPTANADGQLRAALISNNDENPLPPEMQPIEDIRVVELIDGNGTTVLAGLFTGDPTTHVAIRGEVGAIGADSFELIHGDNTATVLVNDETSWHGDLEGLADLGAGMRLGVAGTWADEGVLQAFVVAPADRPQPVRLAGEVTTVDASSFELMTRDATVSVLIDEQTQWHNELTGLADVTPGIQLLVIGMWNADGALQAFAVAADNRPHLARIHGEVTQIFSDGFELSTEELSARVFVSEETEWHDGLVGLDSVELGAPLMAVGAWNDDGSFNAAGVSPAQRPEPLRLRGEVIEIGESGFGLAHEDQAIQISISDETSWQGGLEGLDDLEVGANVLVVAAPTSDGGLMAVMVAPAEILQPVRVVGDVAAIFSDGFTLTMPDGELSIFVDDATTWRGDLTGLADLEVGMRLEVAGMPTDDGGLRAVLVSTSGGHDLIHIIGEVIEIGAEGFNLAGADHSVQVLVGERTQWRGDLTGLGDLEAGMQISVHGTPTDDGTFIAFVVGPVRD